MNDSKISSVNGGIPVLSIQTDAPTASCSVSPLVRQIQNSEEVISRIAKTFQLENYREEDCFRAVLNACKDRQWAVLMPLREDLKLIRNQEGRSLLQECINKNDIALAKKLVKLGIVNPTLEETFDADLEMKIPRHSPIPLSSCSLDHSYSSDLTEQSCELASQLQAQGDAARKHFQFEEAKRNYLHALEISQRLYESNHPEIARLLTKLGILLRDFCKFSEANEFLNDALAMNKLLYVEDHPITASSLCEVGLLFFEWKGLKNIPAQYRRAQWEKTHDQTTHHLKQSLEMLQRIYPEGHPEVAKAMNQFASCTGLYNHTHSVEEADQLHHQAVMMLFKYYKIEPLITIIEETHRSFANPEGILVKYPSFKESEPHPEIAQLLYIYGSTATTRVANLAAEAAYEMRKKLYLSQDHPELLDAALCLSQKTLSTDDWLKHIIQTLAMAKSVYAGDNPLVAKAITQLFLAYHKEGRHAEALPYGIEAIEMYKRLYPDGHYLIANVLLSLSTNYYDTGQSKDCLRCIQESSELQKKIFGPDHPSITHLKSNASASREELWKQSGQRVALSDRGGRGGRRGRGGNRQTS